MNKKLILLVSLGGLMSVLLFSSSFTVVNAATGDRGLDVVQEGALYEFSTVMTEDTELRQYFGSNTYFYTEGFDMTMDTNITITEVNDTLGRIDYDITNAGTKMSIFVTNTSSLSFSFDYVDDDNDGLLEDIEFIPSGMNNIIAGTWENFTGGLDDLIQELEWAKGNVSSFDYSLTINNAAQKISFSMQYQTEDTSVGWDDPLNESVIYDEEQSFIADFSDFVISSSNQIIKTTLNTIVNQSYLEDNDEVIMVSYYYSAISKPKGAGEEGGIPGYELFTLVGLTVAAVFGLAYVVKRKRRS